MPPGNAAFAQSVVSFTPGTYNLNTDCAVTGQFFPPVTRPANQDGTASGALGPPDVPYSQNQTPSVRLNNDAALGGGGVLVLRVGVPLTGDGNTATPDLWVWEIGQIAEGYRVDVSPDGVAWTTVGNSDLTAHGSQGFDIDRSGFGPTARLFYIRITDTTEYVDACKAGSDIDAVAVLSSIIPDISLVATAMPNSGVSVGATVSYSYQVTNTGTDTLLSLVVTDTLGTVVSCSVTTLAPGGTTTCTASHTVVQADVSGGSIQNTATATATPQTGGLPVSASDSAPVTLASPAPSISSISPASATAGGGAFTLVVTGTDFVAGSIVRWNGSDRATTFGSSTSLTAAIPASDIASAGTPSVTVFNPGPGGGTSNGVAFAINGPQAVPTGSATMLLLTGLLLATFAAWRVRRASDSRSPI